MGQDGTLPTGGDRALSDKRARTVGSILSAATLIVTEEGTTALSMSALAARASVSRQTLYNYFPDVEAVLAGLVAMGDAGTDQLAVRMQAEEDARAALRVFVTAAVESVGTGHPSPIALSAALPAELRQTMRAHEERAERLVIDALRRGRHEGVFRADLDPELDGRILYRAAFAGAELARRTDIETHLLAARLGSDLLRMVVTEPSAR